MATPPDPLYFYNLPKDLLVKMLIDAYAVPSLEWGGHFLTTKIKCRLEDDNFTEKETEIEVKMCPLHPDQSSYHAGYAYHNLCYFCDEFGCCKRGMVAVGRGLHAHLSCAVKHKYGPCTKCEDSKRYCSVCPVYGNEQCMWCDGYLCYDCKCPCRSERY